MCIGIAWYINFDTFKSTISFFDLNNIVSLYKFGLVVKKTSIYWSLTNTQNRKWYTIHIVSHVFQCANDHNDQSLSWACTQGPTTQLYVKPTLFNVTLVLRNQNSLEKYTTCLQTPTPGGFVISWNCYLEWKCMA